MKSTPENRGWQPKSDRRPKRLTSPFVLVREGLGPRRGPTLNPRVRWQQQVAVAATGNPTAKVLEDRAHDVLVLRRW